MPASANYIFADNTENFVSGATSATKCLKVISNIEKVLALELVVASKVSKVKTPGTASLFLEQFLKEFTQQMFTIDKSDFSLNEIERAIEFIYLCKL
jgi:histidine ammonia-lyase